MELPTTPQTRADVIAAIKSALELAPDHPDVQPLAGFAYPLRYAGVYPSR